MNKLLALVVFLFPSIAFAGGWTQEKGAHYGKIWVAGLFGNSGLDLAGEQFPTEDFRVLSLNTYVEYGLAEDLTFVGSSRPLGYATHGDRSTAFAGPFLAGVRRRFIDRTLQLSIEARVGGAPGWGEKNLAAPDAGYVFIPTVRTWATQWDLQLGYPLPFGWLALSVGPVAYSDREFSPAVNGFLQLGVVWRDFVIDLHSTLHYTFDAPTLINVTGAGDTRYIGLGVGLSWWPSKRFGVTATADSALYVVSNAYSPNLQLGVETR